MNNLIIWIDIQNIHYENWKKYIDKTPKTR